MTVAKASVFGPPAREREGPLAYGGVCCFCCLFLLASPFAPFLPFLFVLLGWGEDLEIEQSGKGHDKDVGVAFLLSSLLW